VDNADDVSQGSGEQARLSILNLISSIFSPFSSFPHLVLLLLLVVMAATGKFIFYFLPGISFSATLCCAIHPFLYGGV
jgi:Ni,Fe-hydrogenase I cytochrome b subunit